MENAMKLIKGNEELTPTQKVIICINGTIGKDTFDVVSFCEEKGIDTTNDLAVARLFQVEDYLEAAYNDALSNGDTAEALKDPSHLYVVANRFARERELNKGGMSL